MDLDRALAGRGAGIALALLCFDLQLVLRLLLEDFQGAASAPISSFRAAWPVSTARSPPATLSMASRISCSGLMTRRLIVSMAPQESAIAAARKQTCRMSERSA